MTGILATAAAALLAPAALAATPGEIAADLADGRVDGTYTQAELQAYVQSAMVQGYGEPTQPPPVVTPAAQPTEGVAGVQTPPAGLTAAQPDAATDSEPEAQVAGVQSPPALAATQEVGTLPFTGIDLALLALGGGLLLMLGLGARRLGRQRP